MGKLTIGQLARRLGLRTSALRYYEEQGLLDPVARTEAGYRLYGPEAEQTLHFIQQAQRLGFSLADIHAMLQSVHDDTLSGDQIVVIAERRFLDLERRLTELLVVRHEMESFLLELDRMASPRPGAFGREEMLIPSGSHAGAWEPGGPGEPGRAGASERGKVFSELFFDRMIGQVCARPPGQLRANSILDWLIEQTRCALGIRDAQSLLDTLRGQHVHIWQEDGGYRILVVSRDPAVESALRTLAQMEASCDAHPAPQVHPHSEGYLLVVSGENAFIFARLFLALEQE